MYLLLLFVEMCQSAHYRYIFSTLFSSFKSSLINIIIKPSLLNSILIAELVLLWFFLAISVSQCFSTHVCVCGGGGGGGEGGVWSGVGG